MKKKEINYQFEHILDMCSKVYWSITDLQKSVDIINKKLPRIEKDEISPCPFCGCSGMLFCKTINDMEVFYVECTNGHSLRKLSNTKEEAIKKWNERV